MSIISAYMGVSRLDTAQTGSTMSGMDSTKYSATVAKHVRAALEQSKKSVLAVSNETGIPHTTLTRRLTSPDMSPFTVTELSKIAVATGVPVTKLTSSKESKKPSAGTEGEETQER